MVFHVKHHFLISLKIPIKPIKTTKIIKPYKNLSNVVIKSLLVIFALLAVRRLLIYLSL